MYVVAQSVMFPSLTKLTSKEPDIIQATLIFELPSPPPEISVPRIKEETLLPAETEKQPPVTKMPTDSQIEATTQPRVQAISTSPKPLPPKLEEKIQKAVIGETEIKNEVNKFITTEQTITPIPSPEMLSPTTRMARRHLNSFQQQQQNKVADQASRYYQLHKNSPVLNVEIKNPFMTDDEKLNNNLKLRADCSDTSKKTAATLLSLFGGAITCSKPPAIKSFIQDRINKKHLSAAQYPQQEKTRPQSTVIKKQP